MTEAALDLLAKSGRDLVTEARVYSSAKAGRDSVTEAGIRFRKASNKLHRSTRGFIQSCENEEAFWCYQGTQKTPTQNDNKAHFQRAVTHYFLWNFLS